MEEKKLTDEQRDLLTEFDEYGFAPTITMPNAEEYAKAWKNSLIDMFQRLNFLHAELQRQVDELKKRLHMIWAIGVDYDGCDGVESLKGLIDELVGITQMERKEFMACYYGVEVE